MPRASRSSPQTTRNPTSDERLRRLGRSLLCDLRWIEGERDGFARSYDEAIVLHPRDLELRRRQMIALLHADGQYAPESLPDVVGPLERNEADVVLGSRMLEPGEARRGGMPRWVSLPV